jgi:cytochrome P450
MPATGPWLCLTHPDDIKAVFSAPTDVLRLGAAIKRLAPHELVLGPTGLTSVDGEEHRRKRQMQLPPFQVKALAAYEDAMRSKTEEILASRLLGRPVRAQEPMQVITLEVILAAVFGVTDPDRLRRVRDATLEFVREVGSWRFTVQTMVATTRENGWDRPFPRIRKAMAALDAVVLEEVAERRRLGSLERTDVLSLFLIARDEDGAPMGNDEICDAMRTLLIAGHDTTASTLSWTLERVSRHPEVVERLEQAVRDSDTNYIDAVIKEVMRLRPVVPITARLAAEPFDLNGLTIPAGTMVTPFISLVHRRPEIYPDPMKFRPERFVGTRPGTYSWIPFGGGQRRCLGAAFSLLEARIVLTTIIEHARIETTDKSAERISRKNITIVPGSGGTVTLQARQLIN